MQTLDDNWITEKHIDFEYKKYVLLAWLQQVEKHFRAVELYPSLGELIRHYENAKRIRENKKLLMDQFPARIRGIHPGKMKILMEKIIKDDAIMSEIERILDFSIPRFERSVKEGKEIYDWIESKTEFHTVGITPLHTSEGYLLLRRSSGLTYIYQYQLSSLEQSDGRWRSLYTTLLEQFRHGVLQTFEHLKDLLIRTRPELPNPAVYAAVCQLDVPVNETFLPVVKRILIRKLCISV